MQFDEHKKSRADLAGYFVKNAIPTESNFADLISSGLNQRDDGVARPAGGPLSVGGVDARGHRRVLDLYGDFADGLRASRAAALSRVDRASGQRSCARTL